MSKNIQISELINYISVNSSGSIVMTGDIVMPGGSKAATESYVTTAISNLVNAAPTALDTLAELSAALNNDASFATTVTNNLAGKLNLSGGTLTGQLSGTNARFSGSQAYYAEISADSSGGFIQAYNNSTSRYQPYLIYGGSNTTGFSLITINNSGASFSNSVAIGTSSSPAFPLDLVTATSGAFKTIAQFQNTDYTTGNQAFIRVRQWLNAGGSSSSYFGTGQDGNLYIIANNSARGGDLIINAGTGAATFSSGLRAGGAVGAINLFNLYKSDNTTLGGQLAYDSSINQLYLWNNVSTGYFSIYLNGAERFKIAADSTISLSGSTTVRQNFKVLGDTYTSVELSDGGTGDPGYIYLYYNGTKYFSIGANDTYFNYGNVGIGTTNPSSLPYGGGGIFSVYQTSAASLWLGGNTLSLDGQGTARDLYFYFRYSNSAIFQTDSYYKFLINSTEVIRITPNGILDFNGNSTITSANDKFAMGVNSTSYAWIQSYGGRPLVLNGVGNHVLIGQTSANGNANGIYFRPGIESGFIVTSDVALQLSRLGTTGDIQTFYSGTTRVGKISVGSSTVTFESANNGGISVLDSGNTTIGSISGNIYKFNVAGSVRSNRVIYNWYNGAWQGNSTYWHMKTNLYGGAAGNTQYTMSFFKGYSYSYSAHILEGAIGFHNWSGGLYNLRTTGNLFTTAYVSSDGYVVLVVPSGQGETGITLDWHQHWDYPFISATVTAAKLYSATTGGY